MKCQSEQGALPEVGAPRELVYIIFGKDRRWHIGGMLHN